MIAIGTAVIGALITALFAAGTWFINRLINGFDAKIEAVEDKVVANSTKHFENEEKQGNRITRLEAIEEIRNK